MDDLAGKYWNERLNKSAAAFRSNGFNVIIIDSLAKVSSAILPELLTLSEGKVVSYGDSLTLRQTGILDTLKNTPGITFLDGFREDRSREENLVVRRQALLSDIFLTGTNAITAVGQLVNLDMIGNRIAPIAFGPSSVYLFVGRNKLVDDVKQARQRIRRYTAPLNAIKHPNFSTPCQRTSVCSDCKSPDRICNAWLITEKSFPKGRITLVLINEDLGL
ncbi:MAG TPA: lactate utilization protein [Williamwhitmania sp.]|nr:lactate utilization protein [Williamwhitmania sp.]